MVAAGVGLAPGTPAAPTAGTLSVEVPTGAVVQQVLLYWEGFMRTDVPGPNKIVVNGTNVSGAPIGGQTFFFSGAYSSAYRADITGLDLVGPGSNSLTIASPGYTDVSNGAGVIVVYDDGSDLSDIALRDGVDLAFINFPERRESTVPQSFTFPSATRTRVANLAMFFSSVAGTISGADSERPTSVEVTVSDGTSILSTTILSNVLASLDGEEWDTLNLPIEIPAGATELTVQAFSKDNLDTGNLPASLVWSAAALSVPPVTAAIGDTVWQDLDDNGVQDPGEPGVIGVTVNLLANPDGDADCSNGNESIIATDVTDSAGKYLFDGLVAGDYCVEFERPAGFAFTTKNAPGSMPENDSDADVTTGRTTNITLDAGETDLTWDAGLVESGTAAIGDFVWEDCNGNGIQDDAAIAGCELGGGIPGVPVELRIPVNGNCTGALVESTTTGDNGEYLFTDLDPGEYCVAFPGDPVDVLTCPTGSMASYTTKGLDPEAANDSNANPDGTTDAVALEAGDQNLTIDAGVFCSVSIGDTLWEDFNRDGIQDDLNGGGPDSEPGFNGVDVTLFECDGDQVGAAVTTGPAPGDATPPQIPGGAGWYQFDGLVPGCYVVQFDLPDGYVFSDAGQGNNEALDSNVDPNGVTEQIELISGESNQTIDAGINQPPTAGLGDFVFEDLDRDGVQDTGEVGIPGVPVILTKPGTDGDCGTSDDVFIESMATNDMGAYSFNDLVPGAYCVEFDKSVVNCTTDGFDLGAPTFSPQGQGDPAKDSNPDPATGVTDVVQLLPNEFDPTIDAGIYCPAKLGDRVFKDCNGDGIQNDLGLPGCETEVGIPNVMVKLFDCAGNPIVDENGVQQTRVTDSDGFYMFGAEPGLFDLQPGEYVVKFDPESFPDDFTPTLPGQGGDDALDSDCQPPGGETVCTTLPSRGINLNRDCGLVPPTCDLVLDKQCRVETPPPPAFTEQCDGKIQEFTVTWPADQPAVTVTLGEGLIASSIGQSGIVQPGQAVTFFGDNSTNDVFISISGGGFNGESKFHMSCSDDDMDADTASNDAQLQVSPLGQDCGKFQGNAKDNEKSEFINVWTLDGLVDAQGKVLACTPPEPGPFTDSCVFEKQPPVSCETYGKPDVFTFRYLGVGPVADCTDNAASRADEKPPTCSGNLPEGATVMLSVDGGELSKAMVAPGETFELSGFGSQTEITLTSGFATEVDDFHTSCSAPLEVGDLFGNLELIAFDGQRSSATVTYRYEVTNLGDPVTEIKVTDDQLGEIGTIAALPVNGINSAFLEAVTEISATTTNTAMAIGMLSNGVNCAAPADSVTVTAEEPTCDVAIELYKIEDDKIKWKLNSLNDVDATIETLQVSWPGSGKLKKVKFDGNDILKDVLLTSPVTITSDQWLKEVKDRTLQAEDTGKKLELEFDAKFPLKGDQPVTDFDLEVAFEQGCSVTF